MLAAWYERSGPASEVLQVGDMPDPEPGDGEVRIRLTRSGVNPGDVKKRGDWVSLGMSYPRVIPHSDGAGVIDKIGIGVHGRRVGQRVWIYGAQSYRPFGTAAQLTTVPSNQAVPLPDEVSDDVGACLGIPGITAHRAVFADDPTATDLSTAAQQDRLSLPIAEPIPLERIAEAHDRVDAGSRQRILISIPS